MAVKRQFSIADMIAKSGRRSDDGKAGRSLLTRLVLLLFDWLVRIAR